MTDMEEMRHLKYKVMMLEGKLKELESLLEQERKYTFQVLTALDEARSDIQIERLKNQ